MRSVVELLNNHEHTVMKHQQKTFLILFLLTFSIFSYAQIPSALQVPLKSQRAQVTQRIGFTDVSVTYHSPAVNGRKIWGSNIAPYDGKPFLWRAGANENTTISFTDDVVIEGKQLAAGTYGLHMIPTEKEFTIVFSKNHSSWGSYFYDESEDALRVIVQPEESPFREWLTYDFEVRAQDHLVLSLKWENIKIPMKIEVNDEVTLGHIRAQLRSSPAFTSDGWKNAANYCLQNDLNLEEALTWIDRALRTEGSFENYQIKAGIQEKLGNESEALETLKLSFNEASPDVLMRFVSSQIRGESLDKAKMAADHLEKNHASSWQTHYAMSTVLSQEGDPKKSLKHLEKALKSAPENWKGRISQLIEQEKGKADK